MITIKIILLVWFWCKFEPIQDGIDLLWSRIPEKVSNNYFIDKIYILLGCQTCLSMWLTLIITGNIWISIAASIISSILKKIS